MRVSGGRRVFPQRRRNFNRVLKCMMCMHRRHGLALRVKLFFFSYSASPMGCRDRQVKRPGKKGVHSDRSMRPDLRKFLLVWRRVLTSAVISVVVRNGSVARDFYRTVRNRAYGTCARVTRGNNARIKLISNEPQPTRTNGRRSKLFFIRLLINFMTISSTRPSVELDRTQSA